MNATEVRSLVERLQELDAEIRQANEDKRDIYREAKAKKYDVSVLRAVIAYLRKDPEVREARTELFEAYLWAISGSDRVLDKSVKQEHARAPAPARGKLPSEPWDPVQNDQADCPREPGAGRSSSGDGEAAEGAEHNSAASVHPDLDIRAQAFHRGYSKQKV